MADFGGACGAKFSTTLLVSGEKHLLIRWSAYTLGVQVKREGSLTRTPPPPPPPPSVSSQCAAGCGMSRADGYIFAAWEKPVFAYAYSLAYPGRYRIVGCSTDSNVCDVDCPRSYALGFPEIL